MAFVSDTVIAEVVTSNRWTEWQHHFTAVQYISSSDMLKLLRVGLALSDGKRGAKLDRWMFLFGTLLHTYWIELLLDLELDDWQLIDDTIFHTPLRHFLLEFAAVYEAVRTGRVSHKTASNFNFESESVPIHSDV